jgi:hypothetical protein
MVRSDWRLVWNRDSREIYFLQIGDQKTGDYDQAVALAAQ